VVTPLTVDVEKLVTERLPDWIQEQPVLRQRL